MFKSARWRSEKNKIKAVFKLQFHATQISQLGVDALIVSVVPADVGKPKVTSEKATVRDGNCYWENPVYETVKFVREPKSGKIQERLYQFVLGTGSSKAGVVGEVSIDFAYYAEATKTSSISLPLKNANAVLHVSIQRMHESFDQRYDEETETKLQSQDRTLRAQLNNDGNDQSSKSNSTEDLPFSKIIPHVPELNGNHRASSGSDDVTVSSSDSSSGLDTPTEFRIMDGNIRKDTNSILSSLSNASMPKRPTVEAEQPILKESQRSRWEWLGDSVPEVSTDDSSSSPREAVLRESSETMIERLKTELAVLARQAELSELELQTLRKQIVKDSKRGQGLSRELATLKEERDDLKEECEKLKAFRNHLDEVKSTNNFQFKGGDPWAFVEELRQEVNYEKNLNANLRLQLQKTQQSNSELLLAVHDLDEMLEEKNREILDLSNNRATVNVVKELEETISKCETDNDKEQKALEELVRQHSDAKDTDMLEQKIMDLHGEIEIYKRDKDELEMQMEQLALEYEILKQENHDISYKLEQSQLQEQLKMQYECSSSYATVSELEAQIESLENELKKQSKELSDSLVSIKELECHVKNLQEELQKQAQAFEDDLEALAHAKVKQEQRAIRAEETLRKTRLSNAKTAEKLQDELKRLSAQMASTFDANEKLAMKTLTEANELRQQKKQLEEMLQTAQKEVMLVREHYEDKLQQLSNRLNSKINLIKQMKSEIDHKSMLLEHQKKHSDEGHGFLSKEIQLLRTEIEKLSIENNILSEQSEENGNLKSELEKIKRSSEETEELVERGNTERQELENTIALVNMEAERCMKELECIRSLKDEKQVLVETLKTEVANLQAQCDKLKYSLSEDEMEKEKLRKQIAQLKSDVKRKDDAFKSIEKKLKDTNHQISILEGTRLSSKNNKSLPTAPGLKEVASLKEKIKLLEGQIRKKEAALETSTNSFFEKEKNLHSKIEELEKKMEELNQSSMDFCENNHQEVYEGTRSNALNSSINGEMRNTAENSMMRACMSNENGYPVSFIKSNGDESVEKELEGSPVDTQHKRHLDDLLNEIALLKDKNNVMEDELKEMQERYSNISLKFAEVEGERQQLIMTLRSLKNSKKS